MFKIDSENSVYLLTFGGNMSAEEMHRWVTESQAILATAPESFGVVVDMRTLEPLKADVQAIMVEGQQLYKTTGMVRSAVVVNNPATANQFRRLARVSGIYEWERYFDGETQPDWREKSLAWVSDSVDPDV